MTFLEATEPSQLQAITPVITVEDIEQASGFYEKLGFRREMAISGSVGYTIE